MVPCKALQQMQVHFGSDLWASPSRDFFHNPPQKKKKKCETGNPILICAETGKPGNLHWIHCRVEGHLWCISGQVENFFPYPKLTIWGKFSSSDLGNAAQKWGYDQRPDLSPSWGQTSQCPPFSFPRMPMKCHPHSPTPTPTAQT